MRRLAVCAGLAGTLFSAACGTTVPLSQSATGGVQSTAGTGSGLGLGQPAEGLAGSSAAPGAAAVGGSAAVGGTTGSTAGLATAGAAGTATGGTASGASTTNARAVTATTITIGAAFATGTEAAGKALGVSGAGSVAEQDIWNAVVADVNKSGGVLGRKLLLYTHPVDLGTYVANPSQTYGEVCADFKDDHKVFAAMITISDPALRSCLAKMGSPLIVYNANVASIMPAAAFTDYGGSYLYAPAGITNERLAHLFIQSLMANDFTRKWDTTNGGPGLLPLKLGVIHADIPDVNNLYAAYARELAKYGLKFDDTITYSGSASDALAATQGAVLRMKADGITHVFGASAFFLRDAESQQYRPRYAYLPGLGALGAANSPAAQMKGALTVGWAPTEDVDQPQDPGPTPGEAHCAAVMRAAGLQGNRQDVNLMYAVCDAVYSFRDALNAGGQASVPGLRRGYEALGNGFRPALTFTATFGPGRHYGVNAVRDIAYDSECSCLKYTSRANRS
jgi:hypothetical protein